MRDNVRGNTNPTADDIARYLSSLTLQSTSLDPLDHPDLFGDDVWLSKFLIGAAGELFVRGPQPCMSMLHLLIVPDVGIRVVAKPDIAGTRSCELAEQNTTLGPGEERVFACAKMEQR